ncbi:MAG: hypothetical protein AAF602_33325, partial [Myxococcota bacterium]
MLTRREALGAVGEWLLDLEVSGQVFRFATVPLEVLDFQGDTVVYAEGLGELETGFSSLASTEASVDIALDAPESWAELVARLRALERSPATLRRWFPTQTIEQARVVLRGEVTGVTYGEQLEPFGFTLQRSVRRQSRAVPTPGMVVDDTTWPVRSGWVVDEKIIGRSYPVIIGFPGLNPSGAPYPASPGLLVETEGTDNTDLVMIAGHRTDAGRGAVGVWLYRYTADAAPVAAFTFSSAISSDGQGRSVTTVSPGLSLGATLQPGEELWVGWTTSGGGLLASTAGGVLRGAGDVIVWLLQTFSDAP